MPKYIAELLIAFCLLAASGNQASDQAVHLPSANQDPESFPVEFTFLHQDEPTPVRAYFQFNGQPFLIDSLGWRLPIVMDFHYHDRAFPLVSLRWIEMRAGFNQSLFKFIIGKDQCDVIPVPDCQIDQTAVFHAVNCQYCRYPPGPG